MSAFLRTIVTRGYELDARLRVSPGGFARYFEHARWQAIQDRSTGLHEVFEQGRRLVMRAQDLQLAQRLGPHKELSLSVSIAHVGSSSIRFAQTAMLGDVLVAQSEAVAVVLDASGRPTRAPDALRAHVARAACGDFPKLPEPPANGTYTCDVYVRPSDLDTLQHVNQSRYVDFVDDVYQHACAAGAYDLPRERPIARLTIEYLRETRIDPALGPRCKLVAHTHRASPHALGVTLVDPVDGAARVRARIACAHEAPPNAVAARDPGL